MQDLDSRPVVVPLRGSRFRRERLARFIGRPVMATRLGLTTAQLQRIEREDLPLPEDAAGALERGWRTR